MGKLSLTLYSGAVLLLDSLLSWGGVEYVSSDIDGFLKICIALAATVGVYWGRYRHGDITWYGKKK